MCTNKKQLTIKSINIATMVMKHDILDGSAETQSKS
jgi:hypothetical protein